MMRLDLMLKSIMVKNIHDNSSRMDNHLVKHSDPLCLNQALCPKCRGRHLSVIFIDQNF